MAEMRDEHFEVLSSNRAKLFEKQKKTTNIIRTLLKRYTKKQLIEMIEKGEQIMASKGKATSFYIVICILIRFLKTYYKLVVGFIL
jgi:hypothetical protein